MLSTDQNSLTSPILVVLVDRLIEQVDSILSDNHWNWCPLHFLKCQKLLTREMSSDHLEEIMFVIHQEIRSFGDVSDC